MNLCLLVAAATLTGPVQTYSGQDYGVKVSVPGGVVWLEAQTASTIRVRVSPNGRFVPQRVPVIQFNLLRPTKTISGGPPIVCLQTARMKAFVDRRTGTVRFTTVDGKTITAEIPGSRHLAPETLPGPTPTPAKSFKADQQFTIQPDEGIYGLGQHQDGFMDYRGSQVTLEQQNREIAIPFMVSSKGYGLLWNNASHTTVGVGFSQAPVPMTAFSDDEGKPGGLSGQYFNGEHFETPTGSRRDESIDFDWTKKAPFTLPLVNYSVRWSGSFLAPETADYAFRTVSDDGVRLWVDDRPVIDDWSVHAAATDNGKVHLVAGTRHKIRLEFFQGGGESVIKMSCAVQKPSNSIRWTSDAADGIDYCVFYGPSADDVMAQYWYTTGWAPMPPKWALGYWQSKERYSTQQEWTDIAAEYRRRRHPMDNLVQDWFYWDPAPWGSHQFDPKRYPNPAAGIAELHDRYHTHFMISVWGKFNPGSPQNPDRNFDTMNAKGFLYPSDVSGDRYYDAFNPAARDQYWSLMRDQIFKKGVDAWWLDASEPEVNMNAFRRASTAAGLGAQVLNGWPLMHTTGVSQGQLTTAPNKRVFILTRSAYAGQQRTGAACWSGDISATWKVYADQIPAGLNFCMSGIPYWTTDIGAFFVPGNAFPKGASDPGYRELFTRWFQYGSFCPIFRVHGTDFAKEMWRFGPTTEKVLDEYDRLRYRLMPTIYSSAGRMESHADMLMRALVMDFPADRTARECSDEFMFGHSLLVCPVIQPGVTKRSVYLPKGSSWRDFWTGQVYAGGQSISAACPIDRLPLFVRAGGILAMGPSMQYVDEKPSDPIELRVCPGSDGSFELYEDDGVSNKYKSGQHTVIPISWNDRTRTLTIDRRICTYPGMLKSRTFRIVVINSRHGVGPEPSASSTDVSYRGGKVSVMLPVR